MEVAKSEYLDVFGGDDKRPSSALSNHTIRPVDSFASLASVYFDSQTDSSSICSIDHFDIDSTIHQLLTSLRVTSPSTYHRKHSSEHIDYLESSLEKTSYQCDQIIQHFRDRINEATKVVNDLQKNTDKIGTLRDVVLVASRDKLILRRISPKKRHRDSEDSQLTVVSHDSSRLQRTTLGHTSTATQTAMSHSPTHSISSFTPSWLDCFIQSPNSTSCKPYLNGLRDVSEISKMDHSATTSTKMAINFKQLAKKKKRLEEKIYDLQLEAGLGKQHSFSSSTSRVKAWLKRIVAPVQQSPRRLEIVLDIDERSCVVGREVKRLQGPPTICGDAIDASIDNALRNSQVVLEAVKRDLESIKKSFVAVNFYFSFLVGGPSDIYLFFSLGRTIYQHGESLGITGAPCCQKSNQGQFLPYRPFGSR